jgi:hypothetical protein
MRRVTFNRRPAAAAAAIFRRTAHHLIQRRNAFHRLPFFGYTTRRPRVKLTSTVRTTHMQRIDLTQTENIFNAIETLTKRSDGTAAAAFV